MSFFRIFQFMYYANGMSYRGRQDKARANKRQMIQNRNELVASCWQELNDQHNADWNELSTNQQLMQAEDLANDYEAKEFLQQNLPMKQEPFEWKMPNTNFLIAMGIVIIGFLYLLFMH